MKQFDLVIVGAGIIGLAHAFHASQAGLNVAVIDRSPNALGASVRNFGMLALNAQAPGSQLSSAHKSLRYWQEIAPQAGFELRQSGCIFVARAPEEMAVLQEFAQSAKMAAHGAHLVASEDLGRYCPALNADRALGAFFSAETWKVDQRQANAKMAAWLRQKYDVSFYFSTEVQEVSPPHISTSAGNFTANHVVLCGGDEFASLFPDAFVANGVKSCQLQMMRTHPQPKEWRLQPFVMGGLSMSRYSAFSSCPSLKDLLTMQAQRFQPYIDHGIHVIIAQEPDGSITIGDSHAYGDGRILARSSEVDALILAEAADLVHLAEPQIAERWLGHYAYLPNATSLVFSPVDGVTAVNQTSGQGMTHGFSIAQDVIADMVR